MSDLGMTDVNAATDEGEKVQEKNGSSSRTTLLVNIGIAFALMVQSGVLTNNLTEMGELRKGQDDVRERLVLIEATSFTAKDGLELWQQISIIRESLAVMPKFEEFEKRLREVERRLDRYKDP